MASRLERLPRVNLQSYLCRHGSISGLSAPEHRGMPSWVISMLSLMVVADIYALNIPSLHLYALLKPRMHICLLLLFVKMYFHVLLAKLTADHVVTCVNCFRCGYYFIQTWPGIRCRHGHSKVSPMIDTAVGVVPSRVLDHDNMKRGGLFPFASPYLHSQFPETWK